MTKTYYSNGKLLLTGEYVVLEGAKALAVPTKFGQNLIVEETNSPNIHWTSFDKDGSIWFETSFSLSSIISNYDFENNPVKNILIGILHHAYALNPTFLEKGIGYRIQTELTFPKTWGLGTSSTLINNIAQWTDVDAFQLLKNSFGGSGYDIACAQHTTPIVYQKMEGAPIVTPIFFHPNFHGNLYFVYLNKKQNSKSAIEAFYQNKSEFKHLIESITTITQKVLEATTLDTFIQLLQEHENLMSSILLLPTIKQSLFPDFDGGIKSLGAWGGDFILVASETDPRNYFIDKGFTTILGYEEMILG